MCAGCRMGDTTPRGSIIVTDIVIIQLEQGTEMIGILSRTNLSDLSVIDGLRVSTGHFQFIPGNQQLPRRRVIRSPLPPPTICYFPSSNWKYPSDTLTLLSTNHCQSRLLCLAEVTGEDGDLNTVATSCLSSEDSWEQILRGCFTPRTLWQR